MRTYELVCVLDTNHSSAEIKDLKGRIEKHIANHKGEIKATDDMGLMPLAYPLNGQDQWYVVSYHMQVDPAELPEAKVELGLEKGLAKFFFYGMKDSDEFMTFSDLETRFEEIYPIEEEEEEEEVNASEKPSELVEAEKETVSDIIE